MAALAFQPQFVTPHTDRQSEVAWFSKSAPRAEFFIGCEARHESEISAEVLDRARANLDYPVAAEPWAGPDQESVPR
ncbi:MAG TPA: hypothetical protein VM848_00720 [Acidimicrobiia bacterium]|nr:hypothetical protein [Acidimicrobiia bacterium]